jgi:hypothetical protein
VVEIGRGEDRFAERDRDRRQQSRVSHRIVVSGGATLRLERLDARLELLDVMHHRAQHVAVVATSRGGPTMPSVR